MLYYDNVLGINDGDLVKCKFCQQLRYRVKKTGISRGKPVPKKGNVLFVDCIEAKEDVGINACYT